METPAAAHHGESSDPYVISYTSMACCLHFMFLLWRRSWSGASAIGDMARVSKLV